MAKVASPPGAVVHYPDRHGDDGQRDATERKDAGLDQGVAGGLWPLVLTTFATTITLELTRLLFSVGYHLADRTGWITGGLIVVATFASPLLAPAWRRVAGSATVASTIGALIGLRLAVQALRPVPYWLAALGVGCGLVAVTVLVAALPPIRFGLAVLAGLAVDVALRLSGWTWDVPWRSGLAAWTSTGLLVGAMALALFMVTTRGLGLVRGRRTTSFLAGVLLGPLLYVTCFFTASPGFIASSGRLPLEVGALVALADLALASWIIVKASRGEATRYVYGVYVYGVAALLALGGAVLPRVTGLVVVPVVLAVQAGAALCYGEVLADQRADQWRGADHLSLAAGALIFAGFTLVYQISFLVKLPVPAWLIPAAAGAMFAFAGKAYATRPERSPGLGWVTVCLVLIAALVPSAAAVSSAASSTHVRSVDPARGSVTVMTFNINQAVRKGQLDLAEISRLVRSANPAVVVLEEVARGMAVSGLTDEAEWLSRDLGLPYVWAAAGDNQFGNLVLTSIPVLDHKVINLGQGAGTQARSAAFVSLDLGAGRDLLVIGTHLQNGSAPALHVTREQEYRAILDQWRGRPRTILLGDLNTYPGWPELQRLTDKGFHTTQDVSACSMPTSNQNCPDWIFATADLQMSPVRVTANRPDHRPVMATVTLMKGGASG